MNEGEKITYFAETDHRNQKVRFGIKAKDRTRHVYVIGKTGMGKSVLLKNMAIQDIQSGEGLAVVDPHGELADELLEYIPKERIKDVIYFAPFDQDYPISFNVMEDVGYDKRHLVVSGLMSAFKKVWGEDTWSARMEYILNNTLLALLEYPGSTLLGVQKMYSDKIFRKKVVDNVTDPSVKSFWTEEFTKYTDRYAQEATPAISNKIGQFTGNPIIRNIIGQKKSSFDFRKIMDEKKILLVNLSKGRIGEQNANLLGSMLITKIYLAAMSRADVPPEKRESLPNFYFYVDEFQSFANESFANILSEARKYKLNLTIAHQYIDQMSDEVRSAVFGNVGTMIAFRVGSADAEILEKEFAPEFTLEDIVNLGFIQIYLRLMINGIGSKPFSATTLPPIGKPAESFVQEVIDNSREHYAVPKGEVGQLIEEQLKAEEVSTPTPRDTKNNFEKKGNFHREKSFPEKKYSPYKKEEGHFLGKSEEAKKGATFVKESPLERKVFKKPHTSQNNFQKDPRVTVRKVEENKMTSLKEALAKALNKEKEKPQENFKKEIPVPPLESSGENKEEKKSSANKIKEVPEDILKNVLK